MGWREFLAIAVEIGAGIAAFSTLTEIHLAMQSVHLTRGFIPLHLRPRL